MQIYGNFEGFSLPWRIILSGRKWLITMVIVSPLTRAVPLPHGVNGLKIGVTKTSTDWDDPPSSQSLFLNCGRYNLLGKRWKLIISNAPIYTIIYCTYICHNKPNVGISGEHAIHSAFFGYSTSWSKE